MKELTPQTDEDTSPRESQASDTGVAPLLTLLSRPRPAPAPRTIEHPLPSGRCVEVALDQETVRIFSAEGQVELLVSCTPAGCVLKFETANLSLQNRGKIDLRCEELNVETTKQLSLLSQGHMSTQAQAGCTTDVTGTLTTRADEIHLSATSGDAVVQANDFVRMNGEQILLNSGDDPREQERQLQDLWKKLSR
jgi:hypothetical protein